MRVVILILGLLIPAPLFAQGIQTIRGTVLDAESKQPLIGASVFVETPSLIGVTTDVDGRFRLDKVPLGRVEVKCSFIGYEPWSSGLITLSSGKETVLQIELATAINQQTEVTIVGTQDGQANHEMMAVSSRSFSINEANRMAGSISDPGRVALNFPGVTAAQDNDNDVIVRGNSAAGILWRLEGIDVPNLNHFSRPGSSGGGITALSPYVMGNTDFSTGAFPAGFGNAISGVFDINFRKGNTQRHEMMFLAGLLGLNFGAEGPLSKKDNGSSYLFNYRYSTLGILNSMGLYIVDENTNNTYQDLSFNFQLPSKGKARFSIFGIGGMSDENTKFVLDTAKWEKYTDRLRTQFYTDLAVLGVSWTQSIDERSFVKTVLAGTYNDVREQDDTLDVSSAFHPIRKTRFSNKRIALHSFYNRKLSNRLVLRAGLTVENIFFLFNEKKHIDSVGGTVSIIDGEGFTASLQPYAQVKYRPFGSTTIIGGLHGVFLFLNNTWSLEPRLSVTQDLGSGHRITAGYGLHGQYLPLGSYFTRFSMPDGTERFTNRDLEMVKSHHFVLGYEVNFLKHYRFKAEAYYQYLHQLPVSADPSRTFMQLNERSGYAKDSLVSEGTGMNYGLDMTIERRYTTRWFALINGSLFRSQYTPLNGQTYSGAYDSRFVVSATGGYEFRFKNSALEVGFRVQYMGGFRYTPLDESRSAVAREAITIDSLAYTQTYPDYFRPDIRIAYRQNKPKYAWTISVDLGNIIDYRNILRTYYDRDTNQLSYRYQMGFVPLLAFRVDFFASRGGTETRAAQ
ncbi:MAG: carboxypeptidase-like regulatory domain-containing protein [Flavobacteriales bacterium]|nr:carboxypeptidase-like regulatory domain-containing protein [Flavobacteriales bacterium]